MIFNLKFLEKITSQIRTRKKAKREKLVTEEIVDIQLTKEQSALFTAQVYSDFSDDILNNAKLYKDGKNPKKGFHYIKSNGVEGIAVDLNASSYPNLEWALYIQQLANKLKELRYVKQYAAAETSKKNTDITTDYVHYYKPSFRLNKTVPAQQLYGNTTIKISYLNDVPSRFWIKVNTYSDRNFKAPESFMDLLNHLFS